MSKLFERHRSVADTAMPSPPSCNFRVANAEGARNASLIGRALVATLFRQAPCACKTIATETLAA